jgi:hypothetical protein
VDFSNEKIRKKLGGNIVPIGKILAQTTNPIGTGTGTGTGTGIGRNWVKKGSRIGNSPEFSEIPLGIHNQVLGGLPKKIISLPIFVPESLAGAEVT